MRRKFTKALLQNATFQLAVPKTTEEVWQESKDRPLHTRLRALFFPMRFLNCDLGSQAAARRIYAYLNQFSPTQDSIEVLQVFLAGFQAKTPSTLQAYRQQLLGAVFDETLTFAIAQLGQYTDKLESCVQITASYHATGSVRNFIAGVQSLTQEDLLDQVCALAVSDTRLHVEDEATTASDITAMQSMLKDNIRTLFTEGAWLDRDMLDKYIQRLATNAAKRVMSVNFFNFQIENEFYKRPNADTLASQTIMQDCLIPVFYHSHYVLVEIQHENDLAHIYLYNSLPTMNTEFIQQSIASAIKHFNPHKTIRMHTPASPQQTNGNDCGYFVAWFIELLLKDRKLLAEYSQFSGKDHTYFDITYIRERIQLSLAGYHAELPPLLPPTPCEIKKYQLGSFS